MVAIRQRTEIDGRRANNKSPRRTVRPRFRKYYYYYAHTVLRPRFYNILGPIQGQPNREYFLSVCVCVCVFTLHCRPKTTLLKQKNPLTTVLCIVPPPHPHPHRVLYTSDSTCIGYITLHRKCYIEKRVEDPGRVEEEKRALQENKYLEII